jgi:cytochrome c-type biogenesis protein CcmH
MLAPIYLRSGRSEEAVRAASEAIRLLGATPEREATRGEALAQLASGEVTDEAKASFERALAMNPDFLPAKFFLALDLSQEARFVEAGRAWRDLVAKSPPGAPWLQIANLAIADADEKVAAAGVVSATPPPGPEAGDIAAASAMPEADRQAMIEGMVSQLAERLKSAPNDAEGWKRLMRSYTVLGDGARAKAAYADASGVFAVGSAERREIERFAMELGLAGSTATTSQ